MSRDLWRIGAEISAQTREVLLRQFPPAHPLVFCDSITWAFKVTKEYEFATAPQQAMVYGLYRTDDFDAILFTLDGLRFRPDGKRLHITTSTRPGFPRGNVSFPSRVAFDQSDLRFWLSFKRLPLRVLQPQAA